MKKHISLNDLAALNSDQKHRLNEIWIPEVNGLAVARVIKNVAEDEYDEYEFVIGGINIQGVKIFLTDIREVYQDNNAPAAKTELSSLEESAEMSVDVDPVFGEKLSPFGAASIFSQSSKAIQPPFEDNDVYYGYEEDDTPADEFSEEDLEENYQRPIVLAKEDCLPLLNIGDMIEILMRYNYGKHDFYLTASTYEIGCELGKSNTSWDNGRDWQEAELCDVLWESVKAIL